MRYNLDLTDWINQFREQREREEALIQEALARGEILMGTISWIVGQPGQPVLGQPCWPMNTEYQDPFGTQPS